MIYGADGARTESRALCSAIFNGAAAGVALWADKLFHVVRPALFFSAHPLRESQITRFLTFLLRDGENLLILCSRGIAPARKLCMNRRCNFKT
jgi:hypothetical protein